MSLIRYQFPELATWSPFERLGSLREELNRLFDFPVSRDTGGGYAPALDVHDEDNEVTVAIELPGMKKEELDISLHEGVLTVSGERKLERENKEEKPYRSERYYGKFSRSVALPAQVDPNRVTAEYKDGILTVKLPKVEEAKPRQITVNVQ